MGKLKHRTFSPKGPFVVRRPFNGEGRKWLPGQPFPARQLAISPRRLRIMHEQRMIDVVGETVEQEGREELAEAALEAATQPDAEELAEPQPVPLPPPAKGAPRRK